MATNVKDLQAKLKAARERQAAEQAAAEEKNLADCVFDWGKHKGKKFSTVFKEEWGAHNSYVEWSVAHLVKGPTPVQKKWLTYIHEQLDGPQPSATEGANSSASSAGPPAAATDSANMNVDNVQHQVDAMEGNLQSVNDRLATLELLMQQVADQLLAMRLKA